MEKIYIILNASHHIYDCSYSEEIQYMTDSLEDAINEMRKKNEFCETQIDNEIWVYHYILRSYKIPFNKTTDNNEFYTECDNIKHKD